MRQPSVGDVVHYQSYGTPGGEYLPEPRAAIITEVKYIADTDALKGLDGVIEMEGNGSKFIQSFAGREFVTPIEDLPKKVLVSVCVLNPTGMFFNTHLPYAEEPTPGHWNWPPNVDVDSQIQTPVELGENRPCRRCDGCGRVANSEDAEPWTMWEALPPGSDLAVQMGVVRPVTCLDCNGSGTVDL